MFLVRQTRKFEGHIESLADLNLAYRLESETEFAIKVFLI